MPVLERTGLPYESKNTGVMHACGHDCHIAMLLGAARILVQMRDQIHGEVRLIFQPAEEISIGSRMTIKAGALDGVDEFSACTSGAK
ncbi:MAG: M20/M25/M40 family metallo-hydrolase [Eggerthellaceae bacterium]